MTKKEISKDEEELEKKVKEKQTLPQRHSEEIEEESSEEEAEANLSKRGQSKTEEDISQNEFVEFLESPTEISTPILENVKVPQESLEQDVTTLTSAEDEEKKYQTHQNDYETIEESKRINENLLVRQSEPLRIETVGRDLIPPIKQDFQVNPELHKLRKRSSERDYVVKAGELEKEDTGLQFQQKERKYKGKPI
jgi:hypothetical protein